MTQESGLAHDSGELMRSASIEMMQRQQERVLRAVQPDIKKVRHGSEVQQLMVAALPAMVADMQRERVREGAAPQWLQEAQASVSMRFINALPGDQMIDIKMLEPSPAALTARHLMSPPYNTRRLPTPPQTAPPIAKRHARARTHSDNFDSASPGPSQYGRSPRSPAAILPPRPASARSARMMPTRLAPTDWLDRRLGSSALQPKYKALVLQAALSHGACTQGEQLAALRRQVPIALRSYCACPCAELSSSLHINHQSGSMLSERVDVISRNQARGDPPPATVQTIVSHPYPT